jgi:molybdopterin-guanine dinucleotide biosynthesis protein A
MSETLMVAVLAGGEGRRMGGVKALRPFRGAPLVVHALSLARGWSDQVVIAVRDAAQLAGAVETPLAFDRADIPGPLAGLAGALQHARDAGARRLFTLPCDMPKLPPTLPAQLAAALGPQDGVALPRIEGELQPTCGLWRVTALERLPAYVASGQSSLRGFAAACGLAVVEFGADQAPLFANINSLEDLARLEAEGLSSG